jgi:hypothetical protein
MSSKRSVPAVLAVAVAAALPASVADQASASVPARSTTSAAAKLALDSWVRDPARPPARPEHGAGEPSAPVRPTPQWTPGVPTDSSS